MKLKLHLEMHYFPDVDNDLLENAGASPMLISVCQKPSLARKGKVSLFLIQNLLPLLNTP